MDRWIKLCNQSNYHWNPNEDENDVFISQNLPVTWAEELDKVYPLQTTVLTEHLKDAEYHCRKGIQLYKEFNITNIEGFPNLNLIGKLLGFEKGYVTNVQTQLTGMAIPIHIDYSDRKLKRVIVMLQDWYWGQILQFGNKIIHNWKAGDVLQFPVNDIPHSTANLSPYSRTILKITSRPY